MVGKRETQPYEASGAKGRAAEGPRECGAKRTCGEMASCAEARFHFEQCRLDRLDGDADGIPCEALCEPR